jgi:hypothetical protein
MDSASTETDPDFGENKRRSPLRVCNFILKVFVYQLIGAEDYGEKHDWTDASAHKAQCKEHP